MSGATIYAFVLSNPNGFADPLGLKCADKGWQDAGNISAAGVAPGVGGSAGVFAGINIPTTNPIMQTTGFISFQASGGFGGGAFVGAGAGAGVGYGDAPTSGCSIAKYIEGDVGVGPYAASVSGGANDQGEIATISATKGTAGPALGVGAFTGKSLTCNIIIPCLQDIIDSYKDFIKSMTIKTEANRSPQK